MMVQKDKMKKQFNMAAPNIVSGQNNADINNSKLN